MLTKAAKHALALALVLALWPVKVQSDRARIGFEPKLGLGPLAIGLVSSHVRFASPLFCALLSDVLLDTLSPQLFSLPYGLLRFACQLLFLFSPILCLVHRLSKH